MVLWPWTMNVKIISLFKIFDSQCLLQEPSAMTDGNIGLQSMLSWSRGVWLIVEFRMNNLIWNRGLMMLVFYAFLDVSLYVQGVYVIPAYSFPRQKKFIPKPHIPALSVSTAHHVVFTVLIRFCIYIIKALDMFIYYKLS